MDILGGSLQNIGRDRLCNGRVSKAPLSLRHRDGFPSSLIFSYSQATAALGTSLLSKLPQASALQRSLLHPSSTLLQLGRDPSLTETPALEEPTQA